MCQKRLRLRIDNKAEDIPNKITGYKKFKGSEEMALVMHPHTGMAALAKVSPKAALVWLSVASCDVPAKPDVDVTAAEAAGIMGQLRKTTFPPVPSTLRGQWTGHLDYCCKKGPVVTLKRKIASYGLLTLTSGKTWAYTIERQSKYFSKERTISGKAETLAGAIRHAMGRIAGLLGDACGMKDSRRRAALDGEYAKKHPIKRGALGSDPLERFQAKKPKKKASSPRKKASTIKKTLSKRATRQPITSPVKKTAQPASMPKAKSKTPRVKSPSKAQAVDLDKDKALMAGFENALNLAFSKML